MLLFPEFTDLFSVYRFTTISAGYCDPVWSGVGSVYARVEPMNSYERMMNNQKFPNVSEYVYSSIENNSAIKPDDCLYSIDGITRQVKGQIMVYDKIFPRIEFMVERVQFTVAS